MRYGAASAKYFHCGSVERPSESDKHHRTRCTTPAGCQKQNYGHVSCIHVRSMRQQRGLEFCYPKVQTAGMWVLLNWLHDDSLLVFVIGAHPLSRSILAKSNLIERSLPE